MFSFRKKPNTGGSSKLKNKAKPSSLFLDKCHYRPTHASIIMTLNGPEWPVREQVLQKKAPIKVSTLVRL